MQVSISALEKVQPPELTATDIDVRLGATWLPPDVVQDFVHELLTPSYWARRRIKVQYSPVTAEWHLTDKNADYNNAASTITYGTNRINAYKIIEETLNLKDVRIFDTVSDPSTGREVRVLNKKAYHIIQSFKIGELSPELAHEIGREFSAEFLDGYEVVIGTHVDKSHVHNHIIFDSVNQKTGRKYTATLPEYFKGIRGISDRLCKEHGLSVIYETRGIGRTYIEHMLQKAGVYTQRELFEIALQENMNDASSLGRFYTLMQWSGYEIRHDSKYPSFIPPNGKHGFRAKQNGKSLTEDDIEAIILGGEDFKAADVAVRKREYVPFKPAGKLHGFQALVASWMYVLGIYGRGKYTDVKASAADVMRFEQYKRDEEFLRKYGIDNEDQLDAREIAINSEIERLTKRFA